MTPTQRAERSFYLDEFADEVLPCRPTLEAWAQWLSEPEAEWAHDVPDSGAEFTCSTIDVLATLEATYSDGKWQHLAPPEDATAFVQQYDWDGETWAADLQTCLGEGGEGDTLIIACTKDGPTLRLRYEANPPALTVIGEVQ